MAETVKIQKEDIRKKLLTIYEGLGLSTKDAETVADSLINAEMSGMESHGLTRLKVYADRIIQGGITTSPKLKIEVNGVAIKVDGDNGLGQVVTMATTEKVLEVAKELGVAVAVVKNSNHFGTTAFFTNYLAKHGCIGIGATTTGPSMAPFGGMETLLGTNPIAVAVPGKTQLFSTDMATSTVSRGKIRIYEKKNEAIPLGWALDKDGKDTTVPKEALKGFLLPFGGHKGYALAMIVDILAGLLSGSNLSCEGVSVTDVTQKSNTGHFIMAIDIAHFQDLSDFEERAQNWFDKIKACTPRPGMKVMLPGEPESNYYEACKDGINVLASTMATIDEYYEKYGKQ